MFQQLNKQRGFFIKTQMRLEFDEDTEAFFGPNGIVGPTGRRALRKAPSRQNADVSVETLKSLVARVKGIIHWYIVAKDGWAECSRQRIFLFLVWKMRVMSSKHFIYIYVYMHLYIYSMLRPRHTHNGARCARIRTMYVLNVHDGSCLEATWVQSYKIVPKRRRPFRIISSRVVFCCVYVTVKNGSVGILQHRILFFCATEGWCWIARFIVPLRNPKSGFRWFWWLKRHCEVNVRVCSDINISTCTHEC